MQHLTNILVGVDLARCQSLDSSPLPPSVFEPIHWAIQLAKVNSARLLFFSASDLSDDVLSPLTEEDRASVLANVLQGRGKILHKLVQQAKTEGIDAHSKLVSGQGWLEIVRQVLRDKHDLVVVGTRDLTKLGHILYGNTSMKLMRRCPCPVLVTKPLTYVSGILGAGQHHYSHLGISPLNILVATDFRPVSDVALQLGIALARQMDAQLHVLHVVGYQLHDVCNIGLPDAKQEQYRRQVREQAEQALHAQLEKTEYKSLRSRIHIHLAGDVDLPDVAIQRFIETHRIHLLVMGTIAKGGIRGIMIGSTAERLLHQVSCSVLAVKPPDFVCPIER